MREKGIHHSILSFLYALSLFLFILTFSIGLPIYIRPLYYAHIHALDLEEGSGYTAEQIREAYDDVLDYLTLPGREFSVGDMPYSEEGAAHFADCKRLFDLNAGVLLGSFLLLLVLLILQKRGKIAPLRLGRRSASFWAALAAIVLPLVLGALAALDFDRAFVVFHSVFFPGKDNWLFDRRTDPIIRVLPQEFFMHCAILIGVSVLTVSLLLLLKEWISTIRARTL